MRSSGSSRDTESHRGTAPLRLYVPGGFATLLQAKFTFPLLLITLIIASLLFPACQGARLVSLPPELVEKVAARAGLYPEIIEENWSEIESLGGFFTIKAEHRGRKYQAENILMMKKPSLFRLEILNPMGMATTLLVSDGSTFYLYYPEAGEYLYGSSTRENFRKILGIGLNGEELLLVWMGQFIPFSSYQVQRVEWHPRLVRIRVVATSRDAALESVYWIDPIKERLLRGSMTDLSTKKNLFTVEYSDFLRVGRGEVPGRVTVFLVKERVKLTLTASRVDCNPPIVESTTFHFVPPVGARRILLEEIEGEGPIIFRR